MLPTALVTRGRRNPGYIKTPERLRRARKAAGLSASALSLAAGTSRRAATQVESGLWIPLVDTVERLADALRISPAYLAFGVAAAWEARTGETLRCIELAARAKGVRAAQGLSLQEVGRRLGRAASTPQYIERGTMPRLDTLEALAKALNVSPAWLAYGVGAIEPALLRAARSGSPGDASIL